MRLGTERKGRVIDGVGDGPGHAPVLGRPLEALVPKSTDLVTRSTKAALSVAAAETAVAIGST